MRHRRLKWSPWHGRLRRSSAQAKCCAEAATGSPEISFLTTCWTAESFLAELDAKLVSRSILPKSKKFLPDVHRDHLGVHRKSNPGFSNIGALFCADASLRRSFAVADLAIDTATATSRDRPAKYSAHPIFPKPRVHQSSTN